MGKGTTRAWRALSLGVLVLAAAAIGASCGPLFSRIRITGNPAIYAPLGTRTLSLGEYFSARDIADSMSSSGMDVLDWTDPAEPSTVKFLLRYPVMDVPLDFNDYMDQINLTSSVEQAIPRQDFTVPTINPTMNATVNLSFNQDVINVFNSGVSVPPLTVVESGSGTPVALTPTPLTITNAFTSMTFSAGRMVFTFNLGAHTPGLALTLTDLKITTVGGGTTLAQSAANVDLTQANASASLPLAGVALPTNFDLVFSLTTSGGVALASRSLSIAPSLSADTAVSAVSGLTVTRAVPVTGLTAPLTLDSTFRSATVGTGSMVISVPLPASWTGITCTVDAAVSQTGGLNASVTGQPGPTITIPLAGQTISANDISVTATLHVAAVGAALDGLPRDISIGATTTIVSFSALRLHPAQSLSMDLSYSQPVDASMSQWVKSITFSEVGPSFTVDNHLPGSLDITVDSTAFNILHQSRSFPAVAGAAPPLTQSITTAHTLVLDPSAAGHVTSLDFTITASPQGFDPVSGDLILGAVTPGAAYYFQGSSNLVSTWTQAVVDSQTGFAGTFPEGAPLDLSMFAEYLGTGIGFTSLPVHLYASGPSSLLQPVLTLSAGYTDAAGARVTDYLYGNASGGAAMPFVASLPSPLGADGAYAAALPAESLRVDLAGPVNARPIDLYLSYALDAPSVTITPADLGANERIRAEMLIELPFKLSVSDPAGAPITLAGLMDAPGPDLFGRAPGADNSQINDLLNTLTRMELALSLVNNTGLSIRATLSDGPGFSKSLSLDPVQVISLESADIRHIMDTVPFSPVLSVVMPPGSYSFNRAMSLQATVSVGVVANLDYSVDLGAAPGAAE